MKKWFVCAALLLARATDTAGAAAAPASQECVGGLRAAIRTLDSATTFNQVLTSLVNEVAPHAERVAIFIVKDPEAIGWYGRGFATPETVRQVRVPITPDTAFGKLRGTDVAFRGRVADSPGTVRALAPLGGSPKGMLAVPLIMKDKLAAVVYCDTSLAEVPAGEADFIELLTLYAAKRLEVLPTAPPRTGP